MRQRLRLDAVKLWRSARFCSDKFGLDGGCTLREEIICKFFRMRDAWRVHGLAGWKLVGVLSLQRVRAE